MFPSRREPPATSESPWRTRVFEAGQIAIRLAGPAARRGRGYMLDASVILKMPWALPVSNARSIWPVAGSMSRVMNS